MLTIESRIVNKSWAHSQFSFKKDVFLESILRSTPSHTPLNYSCLIKICNQIRSAYLWDLSVTSPNKWSFCKRCIQVLPLKTWTYTQVLMHCLINSLFVWFQLGIVDHSRILWSKQSSRRKSFPSVKLRQVISRSPEQAHKRVGRHVIYWHQEHLFLMSIPAESACESADRWDNSLPCHLTLSMYDIELHIDKLTQCVHYQ